MIPHSIFLSLALAAGASAQQTADVVARLGAPASSGVAAIAPAAVSSAKNAGLVAQLSDDRVVITDAGQPVAVFAFKDRETLRPAFQNVHAPGGVLVTRRHPAAPPDAVDHPTMHPGIWLAFGDINGADFWRNKGRIEHERLLASPEVRGGRVTFRTASRCITPTGEAIATLESGITIERQPHAYLISWDATLAPTGRDLVFGDQEEMGLGVRMTGSLVEKNGGKVALSDGTAGAKSAWGRVADWCVYSGAIGGREVGAAIFAARSNAHRPWWHTRDYGLMVANSFGKRALPADRDGKLTVKAGETLRLKHGVMVFNAPAGAIPDFAAAYRQFNAAEAKR